MALPALITKLVTVDGGYTLREDVLPASVDRVTASYISSDGTTGYRVYESGFTVQWGAVTMNYTQQNGVMLMAWTYPKPFTAPPTVFANFECAGSIYSVPNVEWRDNTIADAYFINANLAAGQPVTARFFAIGK